MHKNPNYPIVKEIQIFNEQAVPRFSHIVTLIIGNAESFKAVERRVNNPYTMDKITIFSIPDKTNARLIAIPVFNSLHNLIKALRNILLNCYSVHSSPIKFNRLVFDLRGMEPNNVAHLIIHAIPLCLLVRNLTGSNTQFLFRKVAPPFQKLLNAFDIDPIITNKKIEANFVKVFATKNIDGNDLQLAGHDIFDAGNCLLSTIFPATYDRYQFKSPLKNKEKIFIARRGTRALINHQETQFLLSQHNYETVFMEDYSIAEQLGIASEARHVVAVHGASMGMLVLNKKIESLIEITPSYAYNDYFAVALADCVSQYIQIVPKPDTRVIFNGWNVVEYFKNQPFSVKIEQLKFALARIENVHF